MGSHIFFHALTFAGSRGNCLNRRPSGVTSIMQIIDESNKTIYLHFYRLLGPAFDFDDMNLDKNYGSWTAYGRSKLSNVLFTRELARRLEGEFQYCTCLLNSFYEHIMTL